MAKFPNASLLFCSFPPLLLSRSLPCPIWNGRPEYNGEKGYEATFKWCQEVEQLLTGQRISCSIPHPSSQLSNSLKILNPKFLLVSYRHLTWPHAYRSVWWSECEKCLEHFEESADLKKQHKQEFIYHSPVRCVRWKDVPLSLRSFSWTSTTLWHTHTHEYVVLHLS